MKKILMCNPKEFSVNYVINPWMDKSVGLVNREKAIEQWNNLKGSLLSVPNTKPYPLGRGGKFAKHLCLI